MKKYIIGIIIGIVLCTTGIYTTIKNKAKDVVKKENVEKVHKATNNLIDTLKDVVK